MPSMTLEEFNESWSNGKKCPKCGNEEIVKSDQEANNILNALLPKYLPEAPKYFLLIYECQSCGLSGMFKEELSKI